jgi:glycosyltransferase involved in cell wall biosynthesis
MRILHIKSDLKKVSGITTMILNLIKYQDELENIKSLLLTNKHKEFIKNKSKVKNADYLNYIKKYNPDIVIFHGLYFWDYIRAYKILEKNNIPYLITPHACLTKKGQRRKIIKKKLGNFLFFKDMIKKSQGLIFLNEEERNLSIYNYFNNYIIPNGLEKQKKEFVKKGKLEIFFLGRINIYHKGLDMILKGLKSVKNDLKRLNIILNIYGKGSDEEKLSQMIENLDLRNYVFLKGPIYDQAKINLLTRGNIMVMTSRYEGLPMSLLEAFSYGVSVFITPETNLSEKVEKYNSGFVTELSPKKIGKNFISFIEDYKKNIDYYTKNSLELFNNNYEIKKVTELSISVYTEVIKNFKSN